MQLFKHIKKLAKLRVQLSLYKALWEGQGRHIRLRGKGLGLLFFLNFSFLLRLTLTRQWGCTLLLLSLLTPHLNTNSLRTL